ncbi:hypothetical protein N3K66_008965 [Trichothecium roseum]|uniref:Uncharacterized protein n=1 Tax=Trichothecium roseum TaxID=47278 RepID=A0ACC0UPV7_9HYPO|nr:hypothetical protein N3K66_008965 [Trichothecium roseum]
MPYPQPQEAPRRTTDIGREGLQYHTPRGIFPVSVVDEQIGEAPLPGGAAPRGRYPAKYHNRETKPGGAAEKKNYDDRFEKPGDAELYEHPVMARGFDPSRPGVPARKVLAAQQQQQQQGGATHPKDRARLVQNPPNDAGPVRGIYAVKCSSTADADGEGPAGPGLHVTPVGLNYHPEGDVRGFKRARLEPMSPEGRQLACQAREERARGGSRSPTWPSRGRDSAALSRHEANSAASRAAAERAQAEKSAAKEKFRAQAKQA